MGGNRPAAGSLQREPPTREPKGEETTSHPRTLFFLAFCCGEIIPITLKGTVNKMRVLPVSISAGSTLRGPGGRWGGVVGTERKHAPPFYIMMPSISFISFPCQNILDVGCRYMWVLRPTSKHPYQRPSNEGDSCKGSPSPED